MTTDPDPQPRFSWGGAGVVLLAIGVLLYGAVGKAVDGNIQLTDASGRTFTYEGGSMAPYVSLLVILCGAVCATLGMVFGRLERFFNNGVTLFLGLTLLWWLVGGLLWRRDQLSLLDLVTIMLGIAIAAGCVANPPNLGTVRALNWVRDIGAGGSIALSVLMPSIGTVPCRADKCGLFGSMWNGFFLHENSAAPPFLVLLPFAALAPSHWRRGLSVAIVAVLTLGSGSRTAILALLVATAIVVLYPFWRRTGIPFWARCAPMAAFIGSALLFFQLIPIDITGRDWVYNAIRSALHGYGAIFGAGSPALVQGSGGWVAGDHGQAPHLLLQLGVVGFLLFGLALLWFIRLGRTTHWQHLMAAGILLVPSSRFLTETGLEFSTRTMEFAITCLVMGLLPAAPWPGPDDLDRTRLGRAQDAVARLHILRQDHPEDRDLAAAGQHLDGALEVRQGPTGLRHDQQHTTALAEQRPDLRP